MSISAFPAKHAGIRVSYVQLVPLNPEGTA